MTKEQEDREASKKLSFKEELEQLINKHSLENESDTPDYVLAEYIQDCLNSFNKAVNRREMYYGRNNLRDLLNMFLTNGTDKLQ